MEKLQVQYLRYPKFATETTKAERKNTLPYGYERVEVDLWCLRVTFAYLGCAGARIIDCKGKELLQTTFPVQQKFMKIERSPTKGDRLYLPSKKLRHKLKESERSITYR